MVVLDSMIKVFTFTHNPHQLYVFETCYNPKGLCVLCPNSNNSLLARTRTQAMCSLWTWPAPRNRQWTFPPMWASELYIALSLQGTSATASEKGTLITNIWYSSGHLIQELRRGSQAANIYCIQLQSGPSLICVSSDHWHGAHLQLKIQKGINSRVCQLVP